MLVGPIFTRELTIAPRRARVYVGRAVYVGSLLGLMIIAWLMLTGTQVVRDVGDLARFGNIMFQILAPLQLVVGVFFSAMLAASAVSQEKDRRTLVLLLLTNLSNSELVLGKLLASLLGVLVLLAAAVPLFMVSVLLGGVSFFQVGQMYAVTLASVLVCGSLGSTVALWREKAFQALSVTVMAIMLWVVFWEAVVHGLFGGQWWGLSCEAWAAGMSPWRAILQTIVPLARPEPALGVLGYPVYVYLLVAVGGAVLINGVAIALVRVWNPSREALPRQQEEVARSPETIWGIEHDLATAVLEN
ncbi:MAG: ABC transporter permease subunit, partial [Pirellulales bacterium]|nr:ABC transporter permease subunit [Pirellulales bacterium]